MGSPLFEVCNERPQFAMTFCACITALSASVFTVVFAIVFVVVMRMGIDGIFLSNILSKIAALMLAEYRVSLFKRYLDFRCIDKKTLRELLAFSLPMLPTALCWWLISSSNRFFIMHYIGTDVNGLYAVAARMTTMLHVIGIIFQ